MGKKSDHIHKLKRHTYKTTGNAVFHCVLPDCYFKVDVSLSLGKRCLCNVCNGEMTINEYSIRATRPRCEGCRKRKSKPQATKVTNTMASTAVESLRERLNSAISVGVESAEDSDDIL